MIDIVEKIGMIGRTDTQEMINHPAVKVIISRRNLQIMTIMK